MGLLPKPHASLTDTDVAAVISFIRTSWGNRAAEVSPLDVHGMREALARGAPP